MSLSLLMLSLVAVATAETLNVSKSEMHFEGDNYLEILSGSLTDLPTAKYHNLF